MIVGLTGGMGCGKTTAAEFLVDEGVRVLDTDAIVHDLLALDESVRVSITRRFGEAVLDDRGTIDRRRLGSVVFADDGALRWLESLLHPRVREIWQREVATDLEKPWVIQIPLLFEKKLEHLFDFTVCVGTSVQTQHRRLLRRGISDEEADQRISRQLSVEEKAARADFYLLNDGSTEFLCEQVHDLCELLFSTH